MIKPAREVIFGVCDKTGNCDSYFGFFKNEEDAKKEVEVQANRLKEDLGMMDIEVKGDRAVISKTNRVEEVVIVIHAFVLR
jgi:hypothetical protein